MHTVWYSRGRGRKFLWKLIVFLVCLAHSLHSSRVWFNISFKYIRTCFGSHSFICPIEKKVFIVVLSDVKKAAKLFFKFEWCKCRPVVLKTLTHDRQEGLHTNSNQRWLISRRSSIEFNSRSIQSVIYCRRENFAFLFNCWRREKKCFA